MIQEITLENIHLIKDNSFLPQKTIINELNSNPFGKFLILKENEKIIGYIYYSDIYERAEINQFEIDVFHRNCGKGQKLLNELIKTVDKNITLEVRDDNFAAIRVYEKFNFKRKAIRKNYYNGKDGILMERVK